MKPWPYTYLAGLSCLYLIHLVLKFSHLHLRLPAFFSHYLADLLCMPLLLSYVLLGMRWFQRQPRRFLSMSMIVVATLYVSVVFEWLLPRLSTRYTADAGDLLMYLLGSCLFVWQQQRLVPVSKANIS